MFNRFNLYKRYRVHYRSLKHEVYDYDIGCQRIHPWITSRWVSSLDEAIDIMNKVYNANPNLYMNNTDDFRIEEAYVPLFNKDEDKNNNHDYEISF